MSSSKSFSRRDLIVGGALGMAALTQIESSAEAKVHPLIADAGPVRTVKHDDPWHGLKIGVATYSLRTLPLDDAIKALQRCGLKYISIKDVHLAMKTTADERKAIAKKFRDAGLIPMSCGNVGMTNDEANIRAAFEYARDIGLPTMVCAPHPDSMPILDKMVKEFDIKLAIHNHGPEDKRFPRPTDVWDAVQKYDKRIGLCIDIGHSARAGDDPATAVLKYQERLYDMHLKDLNNVTPKGSPVEGGRGVLDLKSVFEALVKINYQYMAAFEYEKDGKDPVPGLSETIGYCRGIIASIK